MRQFVVRHRYTSRRDGRTFGPWQVGDMVQLDPADSDWVERDSPGTLDAIVSLDPADPSRSEVDTRPQLSDDIEAEAYELHAAFLAEQAAEVEQTAPEPPTKPKQVPARRGRTTS